MLMMLHRVIVKYHGKESHASAYPWEGVNALDAAVLAYTNLSVLRQQLKPEWRLHGEEQVETVKGTVHRKIKNTYFSSYIECYLSVYWFWRYWP